MKKIFFFFSFVSLVLPIQAFAQDILSSEVPGSFGQSQGTLTERGLGHTCLAITSLGDGLPCSPSLMALQKTNNFTFQIYLGNGFSALNTTNELLYQTITKEYLKNLFSKSNILEMEANAQLTFLTKNFAAQFDPYHVTYFSVIHDPAYPLIALHAMNEKSFNFAGGYEVADKLYVGVQTRLVTRKFIHKEFSLFDAVTIPPDTLLSPKEQNAIYVEPSVTYFFPLLWKPRMTLMGQNLGWIDQQYEELNYAPQPVVGLAVEPPLRYGKLEFGMDYRNIGDAVAPMDKFHFGTSYKLGAVQGLLGVDNSSFTSGVIFGVSSIQVGIVYSSTKILAAPSDSGSYSQTVFTQFGIQI